MKVLVAIDKKPSSQATIDALIKMRWAEGTEIAFVTVLPPVGNHVWTDEDTAAATYDLETLVLEVRSALRQCEILFFVRHGDPKTVILDMAAHLEVDLIVTGSNCKNTLERLLLGSVSQSVMNEAWCPVIIAKTPCCLAREAAPAFKNILVPIDNSSYSDAAVQWLSNFHWSPDTRFIVVAAVEPDTDLTDVRQSLEKRAVDLARFCNTNNIQVEIDTGIPHSVIENLAKHFYADLIVMGSGRPFGLKELIVGNLAQAVSHDAPCAVAVVHVAEETVDGTRRSGAYRKMQPEPASSFGGGYREEDRRIDSSVHVLPGGF